MNDTRLQSKTVSLFDNLCALGACPLLRFIVSVVVSEALRCDPVLCVSEALRCDHVLCVCPLVQHADVTEPVLDNGTGHGCSVLVGVAAQEDVHRSRDWPVGETSGLEKRCCDGVGFPVVGPTTCSNVVCAVGLPPCHKGDVDALVVDVSVLEPLDVVVVTPRHCNFPVEADADAKARGVGIESLGHV
ncbi:MAG: hypothetical protein JKX97_00500 [Candidatus Lindowbacteria bacterium]|nr:hypothetical protein [Candidatus Lindowbacteria bacterium]